jgi:hypothetical protein
LKLTPQTWLSWAEKRSDLKGMAISALQPSGRIAASDFQIVSTEFFWTPLGLSSKVMLVRLSL